MLTLPWQLAQAVAFDAGLSGRVFGLWADELMRWQRARAQVAGVTAPHTGCVMEVQRFADRAEVLSNDAITKLFQASQGVPRAINQLGLQALIYAAVHGRDAVDGSVMQRVIHAHPLYRRAAKRS